MPFYVYILYSGTLDRYYIGVSGDVEGRLRRHNTKHGGYTGRADDWALVYSEAHGEKSSANARERELKSWKSRSRLL